MGNYTKGEWRVGKILQHEIWIMSGNLVIAQTYIADGNEKANAQLIASAPDLHKELLEADEVICELCKRLNPQHEDCTSCQDRENRLKVLAKAEGK